MSSTCNLAYWDHRRHQDAEFVRVCRVHTQLQSVHAPGRRAYPTQRTVSLFHVAVTNSRRLALCQGSLGLLGEGRFSQDHCRSMWVDAPKISCPQNSFHPLPAHVLDSLAVSVNLFAAYIVDLTSSSVSKFVVCRIHFQMEPVVSHRVVWENVSGSILKVNSISFSPVRRGLLPLCELRRQCLWCQVVCFCCQKDEAGWEHAQAPSTSSKTLHTFFTFFFPTYPTCEDVPCGDVVRDHSDLEPRQLRRLHATSPSTDWLVDSAPASGDQTVTNQTQPQPPLPSRTYVRDLYGTHSLCCLF